MDFKRTHYIGQLDPSMEGKKVQVGGWVEDIRELGKLTFLTLRDVTGVAQIVLVGEESLNQVKGLTRQSVIKVTGIIQKSKARDFAYEIKSEKIDILAVAIQPLPIDPIGRLESNIDNRLNARALDLRNQKTAAIFKLRHHALASIRKTLTEKSFLEVNTPKLIGSASEGGANLFSLKYFEKQAYLAQSPQLYKEQLTLGLERIFEIEAAFMDYSDVMDVLESVIVDVFEYTEKNCPAEQKALAIEIKKPSTPFER